MNPPASTAEVPARHPIARSLALAVLGVALVAAAIMGAVVFAVLLGVFTVGYLVSLANNWLRVLRVRRRIAGLERAARVARRSACLRRHCRARTTAAGAAA